MFFADHFNSCTGSYRGVFSQKFAVFEFLMGVGRMVCVINWQFTVLIQEVTFCNIDRLALIKCRGVAKLRPVNGNGLGFVPSMLVVSPCHPWRNYFAF